MGKFFMLVACLYIAISISARQIAGNMPEVRRAEKAAPGLSADQEAIGNIADDWKNAYRNWCLVILSPFQVMADSKETGTPPYFP